MKIIRRFNDGTALVQRYGKDPETIKESEITEETHVMKLSQLDGDGFVIENTGYEIQIKTNTNIHIRVESGDGETHSGVINGDNLLKLLGDIKKLIESHQIVGPSSQIIK